MKKTLVGVAGAAVALSLVGGGTFAHWSDTDSYDNSAGAEHLTLDLSNDATQGFVQTAMAPGVNREFDFVVASRSGQVVPAADLRITLENLIGTENGCDGNKEELDAADGGDDGDCLSPGSGPAFGEYADEVRIAVNASAPTTDLANACNSSAHPRGGRVSSMSLRDFEALGAVDLLPAGVDLAPGEGICVAMGLSLPITATNASQGDSATWDFRYDLEQVIP
jgi:predicted ribosomally synthesized peptide with SipW-like signal peptide